MKRSGFARPRYTPAPAAPLKPIPRDIAERISTGTARLTVKLKPPAPVRHEGYRRLVAALPCIHCGAAGRSQCAHANTGKGMAQKVDDRLSFPLCADSPGARGCHSMLDQGALFQKEERRAMETMWANETRVRIRNLNQWPNDLPAWQE